MEENIEDLLPFYALDALSPADRAAVEAYLAAHPEAGARLDEMRRTASALPHATPAIQPPPELKSAIMDRVRADAASRRQASRASGVRGGWLMRLVAAASILAAIALAIWGISLRNEVIRLQAQTAALQQELNSQRTVLAQLTSPQAKAVAVAGTALQPEAHGQLIADSSTGSAVLVVSGLKPLAADRVYELWLIQGQTAVPAGLFSVDAQGQAILQVTRSVSLASYGAVGVSIEPAGGSAQPSKDIVMLGKVE